MRATQRHNDTIDRARWHLWATTFVIMAALATAVVYFTASREIDQLPLLLSGRLRLALGALMVGFLLYVVDRERHLRRLGERLTDERIESERLSTRLESLTELQRERDTSSALLDGAADATAVVGTDLRFVRFNEAMEQLTGVSFDHAEGGYAPSVLRFVGPDGLVTAPEEHPLRLALASGQPIAGVELRMHVANGEERWVSGTFSPIRDTESGAPVFALVVLRDITADKEMQAMQRDFVSIVSHELRTPLTAIKGFAKTLLQRGESLTPETRASFISTVNDQSDRLARLVDDLLQVSKIDARRLRVDVRPHRPDDIIHTLIREFRSKWTRSFQVDIPSSLPLVAADRHKLEEILINLIDNAVKYSPEGASVRISAREGRGEVEVSIEDRGGGISPEDAAKLFQKFQRLSTPATRDVGGTGLGLYIVKGLVDAMGGRVWVESVPGTGSVFAFTIPIAEGAREEEAVSA